MIVVAAVIEEDGRFLVARRLRGTHLAGYWEFPGGKTGDGEALEDALRREIREELNTGISGLTEIFQTRACVRRSRDRVAFFPWNARRAARAGAGAGAPLDCARGLSGAPISSCGC